MRKRKRSAKHFSSVSTIPSPTGSLHSFHNAGVQNDEEFSWEDDDEEATASTPLSKNKVPLTPSTSSEQTLGLKQDMAKHARVSSQAATSASASPRLSSEDSFDLVSSGNVSVAGDTKPPKSKKEVEEDADSDWE